MRFNTRSVFFVCVCVIDYGFRMVNCCLILVLLFVLELFVLYKLVVEWVNTLKCRQLQRIVQNTLSYGAIAL
jgi:hypothetical protein